MSDDALIRALERLDVALARLRGRAGGGAAVRGRRGGRTDFAGHRPYSPGDDVRTIDWPAHARSGKLVVREFEREEETDLLLIVDASASMGESGKLETARRLAYALAWVALRGGGRVRIAAATGGRLDTGDETSGPSGPAQARESLARIAATGPTRLAESLSRIPPQGLGSRLVVVLSDLLGADDAAPALAALAGRAADLVLLHVTAAPDFSAADDADAGEVVLEDAESGERVAAGPGAAARAHAFASASGERWHAFAARHGVRYAVFDVSAPLGVQTVRALRAAGVLA